MPIMDKTLEFCDSVNVAAAAGTALRGDVIQLPANIRNLGEGGRPLYLVIAVETSFASAGAATVQFQLATDATASIATDGTASEVISTGAVPFGVLTAGRQFAIPLPSLGQPLEAFLGLLVTTAVATTSAGTISAYLTMDAQTWSAFPDGVN